MRDLLAWSLRQRGHEVMTVNDGVALLDRLGAGRAAAHMFDVVITDVRMPRVGGLEALAWLQDIGVRIPIIVITGFGDRDLRAEAERLGAWAVLAKPFDIEELHDAIGRLRSGQTGS